MAGNQLASMIAIRKVKETANRCPADIKAILQEDLRVVHERTMDLELDIVDLRIELMTAKGRIFEATSRLSDDAKSQLEARWASFDATVLKDVMQRDGTIRHIDDVEYENMLSLVQKLKRPGYTPALPTPLNDDGTISAEKLSTTPPPSTSTSPIPGPSTDCSKKTLDCMKGIKTIKQTKLTINTDEKGQKRLGYKPQDDDEGFASGNKKKKTN